MSWDKRYEFVTVVQSCALPIYSGLKETFGCLDKDEIKVISQDLAGITIKTT